MNKINIKSLSRSVILTIVLITTMTIWADMSKPFKDLLVKITGHHWTAKGLIASLFFIIVYFILSKFYNDEGVNVGRETYYVITSAVLGGLAILIFYIWHFFS